MSRLLVVLGSGLVVVAAAACAVDEPVTATDPITEGDAASSTVPEENADGGDSKTETTSSKGDSGPPVVEQDCNAASFSKSVLPEIAKAGCAGVACHGTRFGHDPRLEEKDAPLTYKALTDYKIMGKSYVKAGAKDANESSIHCHLLGQCGTKMPPGGGKVPESMVKAIDSWLACGAPNN